MDLLSLTANLFNGLFELLKYGIGAVLFILTIVFFIVLNYVFGINVGQIAISITVFLLTSMLTLWTVIVEKFDFDDSKKILVLALLCFGLLFLLMSVFSLSERAGSGGVVHIGNDAVSSNDRSAGGSGGFLLGLSVTSSTATGSPSTTITLPDHCYNTLVDGGEEDLNCGGDCIPCHCFNDAEDGGENGIDCDGDCPDSCSCDPGSYAGCGLGLCCPAFTGNCSGHCVLGDYFYPPKGYALTPEQALNNCESGVCHLPEN